MNWGWLQMAAAAATWAATISRFRVWGPWPAAPNLRANNVGLFFGAIYLTFSIPPAYAALDKLTGTPNLGRLVADGAAVVAFWGAQLTIDHILGTGRRHGVVGAVLRSPYTVLVALGTMTALWLLSPVESSTPGAFIQTFGNSTWVLEYRVAALLYPILVLYNLLEFSLRLVSHVSSSQWGLRVRLGCNVAGTICSVAYASHEILHPLLLRTGGPYPGAWMTTASNGLFIVGALLITASGAVCDALEWKSNERLMRRVYYLWDQVADRMPEITLPVDLAPPDPDERLQWMILELKDAIRRLRWYADPEDVSFARQLCNHRGIRGRRVDTVSAAYALACALERKSRGQELRSAHTILTFERLDYLEGIKKLAAISEEYRTSPIVAAVARHN